MRDPFAATLKDAAYVITFENLHKTAILGDPRYREVFSNHLDKTNTDAAIATATIPDPVQIISDVDKDNFKTDANYYKVITHFVKYNDADGNIKFCEVHTLDNDIILWFNNDIKPACFPFVELFCNLPEGDVVGNSECMRVFNNYISYNMINSMLLTGIYRNYHPTKFISSGSGLNIASFSKHAHEPDKIFVVNGDATRAVHFADYPQATPSDISATMILASDMQKVSGIDDRYTGRDTGSVLTTGGVEDMLNRVTVVDTPKIKNYENYVQELTELILANFVEFSMKRTYFKKDNMKNTYDKVVIDYKALSKDTVFHYAVNISSELPKNKQRLAAVANTLMEKQMQYSSNNQDSPDLITTEEWLMLQDLPCKELMQKRMGVQRIADATTKFTKDLYDYASLITNGVKPNDAVEMVGENRAAQDTGSDYLNEVPPMQGLGAVSAEPTPESSQMDQLQQNPMAMLQQQAKPITANQAQIDPDVLAALGNL